jgi:putative SOS response-associated peptidase YedK
MCGRARLSSDFSEIKPVFLIPPHRPTPNITPSWNVAPTDALSLLCETNKPQDARDHHRTPKR